MSIAPAAAAVGSAAPPADDLARVLRDYMDVTQRLARTHETLQSEIERLREELASKDRELERRRRLAALGEMAAGVAHEVRNPLGAIQLYVNLLRAGPPPQDDVRTILDKIDGAIRAVDRVVSDTLALAPRPDRSTPIPIADVLKRAVEACGPAAERARVQVRLDGTIAQAIVRVDGDGLHRALVNLITNAVEAAPRGGAVALAVRRTEGWVTLTITDNGPGLPPELLDRIFDPFFTTKDHGTGLGLTIAHRLVESHGGELRGENSPEGGARFSVRLPIAPESRLSARSSAKSADQRGVPE
ncbi:MAG: hypothetical protein HRU75_06335 [Planctomycetia bacterium]|nr:MAG: hypothetical protein HRU75_06335 [Planctomycetia bacterium]